MFEIVKRGSTDQISSASYVPRKTTRVSTLKLLSCSSLVYVSDMGSILDHACYRTIYEMDDVVMRKF